MLGFEAVLCQKIAPRNVLKILDSFGIMLFKWATLIPDVGSLVQI